MSDAQIFDPENYLLAAHRSPGLSPIKPSYEVVETPPPLAERDSSLDPSEGEEEGDSGEKPSSDVARGEVVLLHPAPWTQETDHLMTANEDNTRDTEIISTQPGAASPSVRNGTHTKSGTSNGLEETFEWMDEIPATSIDGLKETPDVQPKVNGIQHGITSTKILPQTSIPSPGATKNTFDLKPPPRPPRITTSNSSRPNIDHRREEHDSLAESPTLRRFTINQEDGDPYNTLPAMQTSPPRSRTNGSPETKQTLPSLTTALSEAGTPFSAHSPNLSRVSPAMSQYGPSPRSAMSPPSIPSHPHQWRSNTREGSMSTPSDYAILSATGSASTPASSIFGPSPATSHPTPAVTSPEQMQPEVPSDQHLSPDSEDQEVNGFSNGSYKCHIPDCTASPFQTQYLLNSHMNVHSDTRPHFCPVKHCARGPGGQGFKRKNEMIRHGLVHTSPGYMCPFCPDQQHKYPRPDNLQRHVRAHHVDKDRDDPLLREVLAQRPEGGSRGRRRRLGS